VCELGILENLENSWQILKQWGNYCSIGLVRFNPTSSWL